MELMIERSGIGEEMYEWATDLFPICRSLTGNGVRKTLAYLQALLPDMRIREVSTGTRVFDWTIPDEWNINDAYIADLDGNRLVDFQGNNLHIVGYSEPVDKVLTFRELDDNLFSLPEKPDAVPYVTSYYERRWGFCLTDRQRSELRKNPDKKYKVKIDSVLSPGHLTYGELVIPGTSDKEVLLSTYVCHPSMANNELSGPCVAAATARWIQSLEHRKYTYRVLFLVETIGSITYLSQHLNELKKNLIAGYVLTCIGDDNGYSLVESRLGGTLAERVAKHVLEHTVSNYKLYSFLERGSDERQYCSPGVDLPVCTICRSKYREYPEYHTSEDDLSFISPQGLKGGFELVRKCLEVMEDNAWYRSTMLCEPQLGKYDLHPTLMYRRPEIETRIIKHILTYSDGNHSLVDIAEKLDVYVHSLIPSVKLLVDYGLLELVDEGTETDAKDMTD